jgi:penicillin amidase
VHAEDRLFMMDENRRTASGTLAELLGSAALPNDIQLRTLGLRRAAQLSQLEYSARVTELLNAYSAGVNAWVASHPLPPEYAAVEITNFEPWTPLDSIAVAKLLAFGLSFELDIDPTVALLTYQGAGQVLGVNGTALFFEDLYRVQPFSSASTVPDATSTSAESGENAVAVDEAFIKQIEEGSKSLDPNAVMLAKKWVDQLREIPFFERILDPENRGASNEWAIAASLSATGQPLVANDPHLSLRMPATFYPIVITGQNINAAGHGFPGAPLVVQGHNERMAWGSTVNPLDVTDVYQETVVPDAAGPAGLSSLYKGVKEPLAAIPQTFRINNPANGTQNDLTVVPPSATVPQATLIVSRRNAPIVSLDLTTGAAVSVQYVGFGPTRELETFVMWNQAKTLDDFKAGLQYFDVGSQNFIYADIDNNIAYFTSGEMPIREDLQAGAVVGLPPFFLRNGAAGGNDWIRVTSRAPTQASSYQILPAAEMPSVVNPAKGWIVNANNDPAGTTLDNNALNQLRPGGGIYYLNGGYSGFRAGRITEMIRAQVAANQKFTVADMQRIQADVVLLDAKYFVPYITRALDNAAASNVPPLQALGTNPAIAAAVNRLRTWDFSTPTGIPEGYDSADQNGVLVAPSSAEIQSSIAATLYSVWRSQFIKNTVDAVLTAGNLPRPPAQQTMTALKNLLDNYDTRGGAGVSGVQFFNVPGIPNTLATAPTRRDILILTSMGDTLTLLAGDSFAPAFAKSTNQEDYRWGKLHRIVFRHPLGGPYNTPPAGIAFPAPLAGLDGVPVDGGFEVVDASSHNPRLNLAAPLNGFMFSSGPNRRMVSEATDTKINAVTSLPGGVSGLIASPLYINLLKPWLTNEAFPIDISQRILLPWGAR